MSSDLSQTSRRAFAWNFSGRIAALIVNFFLGVVLARLLAPSDFGLIALVMVNVAIAEVIFELGLGASLIQRDNINSNHYSSVFIVNGSLGLLISFLVYAGAETLSEFYSKPDLVDLIEALSVVFFLSSLTSIHKIYLRREFKQKQLNAANLVSILSGGVFAITLAINGFGVWSLVVQKLIYFVVNALLCWRSSAWRPKLKFSTMEFFELFGFGFKVFVARVINAIFRRADTILVGRMFDLSTVGFYQRARSLNEMSTRTVSQTLESVMLPMFSRSREDKKAFSELIVKGNGMVCFVSFWIFGALYVSVFQLVEIIYTAKWLPSAKYLEIFCLSAASFPINALLVSSVQASGEGNWLIKMVLLKRSLFAINLAVGFYFNIEVFLYGLVLVGITNTMISSYAVRSIIGCEMWPVLWQFGAHAVLAFLAGAAAIFIDSNLSLTIVWSALAKILIFSFMYLCLCRVFRLVSLQNSFEQMRLITRDK